MSNEGTWLGFVNLLLGEDPILVIEAELLPPSCRLGVHF
jgi:hypothetical protein